MIEINNLTTITLNEDFLKKIVIEVLKEEIGEKKSKDINLSIAFVGAQRMRKLNKKYRNKNRITDVLSFPGAKTKLEKFKTESLEKIEGLGEIVICLKQVKKNTKRFKNSFKEELTRVLIHGVLHLLGYENEKSEKQSQKMQDKQNYYLKKSVYSIQQK